MGFGWELGNRWKFGVVGSVVGGGVRILAAGGFVMGVGFKHKDN